MSSGDRLKRFNQIGLAILLVIVILIAVGGLLAVVKRLSSESMDLPAEQEEVSSEPEQEAKGDVVHAGDRRYAVFWQTGPGDARMDMSIVSMANGDEVRLSERRAQQIFQFEVLNYPYDEEDKATAYVALVRTGGPEGKPICNLVIGRLGDLKQTVAARNIIYLDAPGMTDATSISMVLTNNSGQSEFRIFDLKQMRFVGSRVLSGSAVGAVDSADAAPGNNAS